MHVQSKQDAKTHGLLLKNAFGIKHKGNTMNIFGWLTKNRTKKNTKVYHNRPTKVSESSDSTTDFVLGTMGVPMPSTYGMAGFAAHNAIESTPAKAEDCSPSSYSSDSSSVSSSGDSGSSCGGGVGGD